MKKSILKLRDIVIDEKLYPRKKVNKKIVYEYRNAMERGDIFPPIFVGFFKDRYYLIDGRHRLEAMKLLSETYVTCEVKNNFPSFEDMFLASVRSNLQHGHQLIKDDRLKIAYKLKDMDYLVDDISKIAGIQIQKLERMFVNKISKINIRQKIRDKEFPDTIKEKLSKHKEREIGAVNSEGKIITKREMKDDEDIAQLDEIYKFLKYRSFNRKNDKISELLYKIEKLKIWRVNKK